MTEGAVLVTGASGFVGLAVLEHLLSRGRVVVGLSASPIPGPLASRLSQRPGRLIERIGDVRDAATLEAAIRCAPVDSVIHLAAVTSGAGRETDRAWDCVTVNLGGLVRVMQAASDAGIGRFVLASSVAVYGQATEDGVLLTEDVPVAPGTLYAITKAGSEQIALRLAPKLGLDLRIGRLGRVFGPDEYDTGVRDTLSQIFTVTERARRGLPVHLARPCVKNWQCAPDAAACLVALLGHPNPSQRLYNLGAPYPFALSDWCARLSRRYPGFFYTVGPASDAHPDSVVDLWGDRDGGLLSWQRFASDIGAPPATTPDAAFGTYMNSGAMA